MRRRSVLFLPAALAMALVAVGCGSSGASTEGVASAGDGRKATSASDGTAKPDPQQAGLDFARCMREHGVDVPDPSPDRGGLVMIGPGPGEASAGTFSGPPPGFEDAHEACGHFLDDIVPEGGGALDPKEQDRALAFAKCMRDNGVDMPDPDFSGGRVQIRIGGDGSQVDQAKMEAAHKACSGLFGPAGGTATGPGLRGRTRS